MMVRRVTRKMSAVNRSKRATVGREAEGFHYAWVVDHMGAQESLRVPDTDCPVE